MVCRWSRLHLREHFRVGGGALPCRHPSVFYLTDSTIDTIPGNLGGVSQLSDYSPQFVVIGGYTPIAGGSAVGLSVAVRDPDTGALRPHGEPTPTPAPSFVARHPARPVLYAVNELADGAVSAFAMTPDGRLTDRGTWPTGGAEPCHLIVTPDGRHLLVANYASGSVASFPLDPDGIATHRADLVEHTGSGPHPELQASPHAHQLAIAGDRMLAVDLGADTVFSYLLDPRTGALGEPAVVAALTPGTGPRHVTLADGAAYLVGELSGTVTTFAVDSDNWLELGTVPASMVPGGFPSEIGTSADGRFLYVANRGPDTITTFAITDKLPVFVGEVPAGGAWPRHFVRIEQFLYVANERSHTVVVFRLDPHTGLPTPTGDVLPVPSPTCVLPW
jgi:6-phosphogluconolactonase